MSSQKGDSFGIFLFECIEVTILMRFSKDGPMADSLPAPASNLMYDVRSTDTAPAMRPESSLRSPICFVLTKQDSVL